MTNGNLIRRATLACIATAAFSVNPAIGQVSFNISVGPPPPMYEPVPMMAPGYVWAPGYWAWHDNRHIWVHGRSIVQRNGYRWEPDRWDQRGTAYVQRPGRWERDTNARDTNGREGKNAGRGPRGNSEKHRQDGR